MRLAVIVAVVVSVIALVVAVREEPASPSDPAASSSSAPDWIVVTVNSASRDDWVLRGPHIIDTDSVQMVTPNSTEIDAVDPKANLMIEVMGTAIGLNLEETVSQVCAAIGDCSILAGIMPTSDEISEQIQRQMRAEDAIRAVRERRVDESDPDNRQWLDRCDANGNGRVTCAEARAGTCGAPIPVTDEHPLYQFMMDGDGNGRVCG